ncbi:BTAD domain-containing putative transcriptional regulator [uncultured Friedmanniella sp.]|uniref:BTAD domain-containing putative transcriptional regulator n=1 Tax=uncultured Friedmanniella sp. TaxID=335381 RepID=UPI0035CB259C
MLEIAVLGAVAARLDGVDVELGGPRQRAVLAMLVAAGPGRLVSVDRFVEDLWAGEPPPKALAALHAYVSKLRRALEPARVRRRPAAVIVSAPPGYRLNLPVEAVDSWWFDVLTAQAGRTDDPAQVVDLLERADACWHGAPFAAYADHAWARPVAEALIERRAGATELRAAALLKLGRAAAASSVLLPHVREHPLREKGVELLATALYRDGRQGEALAAIARIRSDLAEELGVDPGPRLRALEVDVLGHADRLAGPPAPSPQPDLADTGPAPAPAPVPIDTFVGREDELTRLREAFDLVSASGRPGVVWVSGEAGIGKSTLAEQLAQRLPDDVVVARSRCPDVVGAPSGWPWQEVLRELGRTEAVAPADAFTLGRMVERSLAEQSGRPVLVLLEDLHRAEEETLQVLRQVLATRVALLVVGTFRSDHVGAALGTALAAVAERTVLQVELAGLAAEPATVLLSRFGRRSLPADTAQALVARSGGNPLFLREIGQLVSAEGATAGLSVPPVIRELLNRRIDRLPASVVDLLARAAVLGRDLDLDLLVTVEQVRGGLTEDEVLEALDAGLVAGLLELRGPSGPRFAHALTRDTLYERLPPLRRRRLHADLLGVLERDRPDGVEALAHHAAASLEPRTAARAAGHLETAATAAAAIGVSGEVVRYASGALAALDLLPADPPRRLRLLRLLGGAQAGTGDTAAARATRAVAVQLAQTDGTPRDVAEQLTWDTPTVWTIRELGRVDTQLVERLERALAETGQADLALRCRLLSSLVLETESSALVPRAEEAAAEAVALASMTGDPRLICQALNAAYLVTSPPRPPDRQWQVGHEMLAAAQRAGSVGHEAVARHILFGAAAGDGDLTAAEVQVEQAVRCAAAGQLPGLLGVSALFDGARRLVVGDLEGAEVEYGAVVAGMEASGDPNAAGLAVLLRFATAAARGDTSALRADLQSYLDAPQLPFRDLLVRALLDAGERVEARSLTASLEPLPHAYLWDFFRFVRAANAAELGDLAGCEAGYAELTPFTGRLAGLSSGSMTLGPVDHVLGLTAAALGRRDDAIRHVQAARALADRYGNRAWSARAAQVSARLAAGG